MNNKLGKNIHIIFLGMLFMALIVKGYIMILDSGHSGDLHYYRTWSSGFLQYGFRNYVDQQLTAIDYPPLYFMILSPFVYFLDNYPSITNFGIDGLFMKAPSLLAELLLSYVFYCYIIKKYKNQLYAYIGAFFLFLHPVILINGAGWGQTDAILSLLFVIVFVWIATAPTKKLALAMTLFGVAFMLKPTALLFMPFCGIIILYYLIKQKDIKQVGLGFLGFGIVVTIISLPFKGFNVFTLYLSNSSKYPKASLRAANLHTLFGGDGVDYLEPMKFLPMNYKIFGYGLFLLFFCFLLFLLFYKKIDVYSNMFTLLWIYTTGMFLTLPSMHERYQYFAIAFGAFALIEQGLQHRYLLIFFVHSIIIFFNHWLVLHFAKSAQQVFRSEWIEPFMGVLSFLSLLNLLCFLSLLYVLWKNPQPAYKS